LIIAIALAVNRQRDASSDAAVEKKSAPQPPTDTMTLRSGFRAFSACSCAMCAGALGFSKLMTPRGLSLAKE